MHKNECFLFYKSNSILNIKAKNRFKINLSEKGCNFTDIFIFLENYYCEMSFQI